MEGIFIVNDTIKLVLKPTNDTERQLMNELYNQGELVIQLGSEHYRVLDNAVPTSLIIEKAK
jgi:hypothetical protein